MFIKKSIMSRIKLFYDLNIADSDEWLKVGEHYRYLVVVNASNLNISPFDVCMLVFAVS